MSSPLTLWLLGAHLAATPGWLYVTSFQSGKIYIIDLEGEVLVRRVDVADGAGTTGLAVTSDGSRLLVADDARLRIIAPRGGEVLKQVPFENRALLLGGGPVVHLSADDKWLFAATYDYQTAATGMRIFDIGAGGFLPLGFRSRECETPALFSAKDGMLVTVCPGFLRILRNKVAAAEFLPEGPRVQVALHHPSGVLSADGNDLYLFDWVGVGTPWRLVHWRRGEGTVNEIDLATRLAVSRDDPRGGGSSAAALSADGCKLLVVQNRRVHVLDTSTLQPVRSLDLQETADGAAMTVDGKELVTVLLHSGDLTILRIAADSGESKDVRIHGVQLRPTDVQLAIRPPPPP